MKRWWGWIALVSSLLAAIAFSDIGEDLSDPGWPALEQRLAAPFVALRSPALNRVMLHLTWLGSQPLLAAVVVVACLLPPVTPRLRDKLALLFTSVATSLVNLALKGWFARARPGAEALPLYEEPYYSFPSGHAMISLVIYGFLIYLAWRHRFWLPWTLFLVGLIVTIGVTRIYLAVHYPGDVLAGFVAGWPCLCLGIYFHRRPRA